MGFWLTADTIPASHVEGSLAGSLLNLWDICDYPSAHSHCRNHVSSATATGRCYKKVTAEQVSIRFLNWD